MTFHLVKLHHEQSCSGHLTARWREPCRPAPPWEFRRAQGWTQDQLQGSSFVPACPCRPSDRRRSAIQVLGSVELNNVSTF